LPRWTEAADFPAPGHKIFPCLLRNLTIDRPDQIWAANITYIPIGRGFLYLVAVLDWASRAVCQIVAKIPRSLAATSSCHGGCEILSMPDCRQRK
jgi:transposase InsO family protein